MLRKTIQLSPTRQSYIWHMQLTIWAEALEATAFVALRDVHADAGVATRAGVAAITFFAVGTNVAGTTLALVPILYKVYMFQRNSSSVLGDAAVGHARRFLKIQVFWDIMLCHRIKHFRFSKGLGIFIFKVKQFKMN